MDCRPPFLSPVSLLDGDLQCHLNIIFTVLIATVLLQVGIPILVLLHILPILLYYLSSNYFQTESFHSQAKYEILPNSSFKIQNW
jgi:hypothetical protein